jgi:hypothetical protein
MGDLQLLSKLKCNISHFNTIYDDMPICKNVLLGVEWVTSVVYLRTATSGDCGTPSVMTRKRDIQIPSSTPAKQKKGAALLLLSRVGDIT